VNLCGVWPWLRRGCGLEAGQLGEREVEVLADRLVLLLLAKQLVCTQHTTTSINQSSRDFYSGLSNKKYC